MSTSRVLADLVCPTAIRSPADTDALVTALAARFAARGVSCARQATHISEVLLAGAQAYKFKKPRKLGFLDFSTLALRAAACAREVALNRRYAPMLYLDVVRVTGGADGPTLGGDGPLLDHAVWMRRFPDAARLDLQLAAGSLDEADCEALGHVIAALHRSAGAAPAASPFGTPALVRAQMLAGLDDLAGIFTDAAAGLARYRAAVAASEDLFAARRAEGCVRDCHGDLHLSNLVRLGGSFQAFDCIEFSDELRYIDTLSDLAFLLMDLKFRGAARLARALRNAYLADTGDYRGLPLLPLYEAYRSVVRARVAWLGAPALPGATREAALERSRAHLALAAALLAPRTPRLVITHGVSGSGKTWQSRQLALAEDCIHLRSDLERKRLAGLAPLARSGSLAGEGLYTSRLDDSTYDRLHELAALLLRAGFSVIVDATFLQAARRARFRALADALGCEFRILACSATEAELRARIAARHAAGTDASEATQAVLTRQLAALSPAERAACLSPQTPTPAQSM